MRYGALGTIDGGRRERFLPGAFGSLPDAIDLTLQHDPRSIVGRVALTDSATELRAAGEVTPAVHDLVRRRALSGLSVEIVVTDETTVPDFGASVREVRAARLAGLSVVDAPAYPASGIEARRGFGGFRTEMKPRRRMDCKCADGDASEVEFGPDAFRGVEGLDVTAIARGAESVIASTATGSLTLRRAAGGALAVSLSPIDTEAGRRTRELLDAGQPVFARPIWTTDQSEFEVRDGVAYVSRAWFQYLLVRPVPEGDARGLDALKREREGRGLTLRRRLLIAGAA